MISAGAGLALVAAGTAAGAAIAGPIDGSGVIYGCYYKANNAGSHTLVLQDVGTTCPNNTTAIKWNQTGPQGPTGPQGAKGDTGAVGPVGPVGATGAAGPAGATGPAGPAGADGKTVLNGTGTPASTVGNDGDFYLDTAADVLYGPKAGGTWPANGVSLVGPEGPAGAPGAGATVTSLASGDAHCANGGASIKDGTGTTAYACTGATGPAGTTGQHASTVAGTGDITVDTNSNWAVIPGMTQTVTVPANGVVLISTTGGAQTDGSATNSLSLLQFGIFVDGALSGTIPTQQLIISNTTSLIGDWEWWNLTGAVPMSAGTHTITVQAEGLGGNSAADVGGAGLPLRGGLTVAVLNT
jgi:hypothetical protein